MGPGARRMALDDCWSGWNWKKILGMGAPLTYQPLFTQRLIIFSGELLLRNLLKALLMKAKHTSENKKFDANLPKSLLDRWLAMIQEWESNKSNPNPYTHTEKGVSGVLHRSTLNSCLSSYQSRRSPSEAR